MNELFLHQELEIQDTRGGAREEEVLPPDWKLPWLWNQVVMEDLHSRASWRGGAHERGRAREGVRERVRVRDSGLIDEGSKMVDPGSTGPTCYSGSTSLTGYSHWSDRSGPSY